MNIHNVEDKHESEKVWDLFIRLFHVLLIGSIGFAWWSAEQGGDWMEWHLRCGYLIIVLITARITWGFIGSFHARFKNFVASPSRTASYTRQLTKGSAPTFKGHNPLGGWMVLLLLGLCLLQGISGLFSNDDIFTEGPLVAWISYDLSLEITQWHKSLFNILLGAIGLHISGVLFHQLVKKEKLIQAMFHGRK